MSDDFSCNSSKVIYLISCKNCEEQYIESAIDFKARFRIHKSDITTKKYRCVTARYFNNKCSDVQNLHSFLQVQLTESLVSDLDLENKLWEREKCWECQLFTSAHDMNSVFDVYTSKGKRCRTKCYVVYVIFGCPVPLQLHVGYRYCFLSPSYCVLR